MAIDPTLGFGTITGGTSAVPVAVLAACQDGAILLVNREATNWFYARAANSSGPFINIGPSESGWVVGGKSLGRDAAGAIVGFVSTQNGTGSANSTANVTVGGIRMD